MQQLKHPNWASGIFYLLTLPGFQALSNAPRMSKNSHSVRINMTFAFFQVDGKFRSVIHALNNDGVLKDKGLLQDTCY